MLAGLTPGQQVRRCKLARATIHARLRMQIGPIVRLPMRLDTLVLDFKAARSVACIAFRWGRSSAPACWSFDLGGRQYERHPPALRGQPFRLEIVLHPTNKAKVKPNNYRKPGDGGNCVGCVVPKTSPHLSPPNDKPETEQESGWDNFVNGTSRSGSRTPHSGTKTTPAAAASVWLGCDEHGRQHCHGWRSGGGSWRRDGDHGRVGAAPGAVIAAGGAATAAVGGGVA